MSNPEKIRIEKPRRFAEWPETSITVTAIDAFDNSVSTKTFKNWRDAKTHLEDLNILRSYIETAERELPKLSVESVEFPFEQSRKLPLK